MKAADSQKQQDADLDLAALRKVAEAAHDPLELEYVYATAPAVVLALLDRIEELEGRLSGDDDQVLHTAKRRDIVREERGRFS